MITRRVPHGISRAALRFAREVVFSDRGVFNVPKLTAIQETTEPPTAWFICPDNDLPSGGVRKLYRSVDILNEAGFRAAIVHERSGFNCTWFDHQTRVIGSTQTVVRQRDLIVVPEIYGASIRDLPTGIRQIIFNQNAYIMLGSLASGPSAAAPYVNNPDLTAVIVVSEDNAALIKYLFPCVQPHCVRNAIDPALHHPPTCPKWRRIAFMPRKRAREIRQVLALLKLRGVLNGWEVIAIDGQSEADAAELLRTSQIFLSFSQLEGFGLPPLEALACGCLVVGYHGFGGREFFRKPYAISIEDGDIVAFAQAVEDTIHFVEDDPTSAAAARTAGIEFVLQHYTPSVERKELLDLFAPLLRA